MYWPLLDLGDNILLLEDYNVRTFPEYILIRKGNKIGEAPAPSPERYLEGLGDCMGSNYV